MIHDDAEGSTMATAEPNNEAVAETADELATLLAALAAHPEGATTESFVRRASALSTADQATLHTAVRSAKVALRPYNEALKRAIKRRRTEAERAEREGRLERLSEARPTILCDEQEHRVADDAIAALGRHPDVYQRAGSLVNVRRDLSPASAARTKDAPRIALLPLPTLREYLSACALWVVNTGNGPDVGYVPQSAVNAVHVRGEWKGIRTLEGVVECPMLRPDGTVLEVPGYDAMTGLLFLPNDEFPPVPDQPSREQVEEALALLFDVVVDFPFKSRAHRAAWLSALLTPLGRFAFRGCSPLNMIDGNTAGAGKGRLVNVIGVLVQGRDIGVMTQAEDDAEQRKAITSKALAGARLVLIDNVEGALGGPALDAALTSTSWEDRLLGTNLTVTLPLSMVWFATGNNIQPRGDLIRRALHIRLETPYDRPEDRRGFRHENLEAYVRENRAALVVAALTILRGYCAAGRPAQKIAPWGSFESWSDLVRAAIVWAGEPDPAETREELRAENDVAGQAHLGLVEGWRAVALRFGGVCSAREALEELARSEASAGSLGGSEGPRYDALRAAFGDLLRVLPGKQPTPAQVGILLRRFRAKAVLCSDGVRRALIQPPDCDRKFAAKWTVGLVVGGIGGDVSAAPAATLRTSGDAGAVGSEGMGGSEGIILAPREEECSTFDGADGHAPEANAAGTIPPDPLIPPCDADDLGPQWLESLDS